MSPYGKYTRYLSIDCSILFHTLTVLKLHISCIAWTQGEKKIECHKKNLLSYKTSDLSSGAAERKEISTGMTMTNLWFSEYCQQLTCLTQGPPPSPISNYLQYRINQHWLFIFKNVVGWGSLFTSGVFLGEGRRLLLLCREDDETIGLYHLSCYLLLLEEHKEAGFPLCALFQNEVSV